MRWDFTLGTEGFEFEEETGSTSGYWSNGRLYMDGDNSWGYATWRIEFPRGVYAVKDVSTVRMSFGRGANMFVNLGTWSVGDNFRYDWATSSPYTFTAEASEEIQYIGVQCNIYGNGFYAEWIEIAGFTGLTSIPGYPSVNGLFTSATQFGTAATQGIFTNGVQFDDQSTNDIFVSNTRLDNG